MLVFRWITFVAVECTHRCCGTVYRDIVAADFGDDVCKRPLTHAPRFYVARLFIVVVAWMLLIAPIRLTGLCAKIRAVGEVEAHVVHSKIGVMILALAGPTEASRSVAALAAGPQSSPLDVHVNAEHTLLFGEAIKPVRARVARGGE